MREIKFRAWDKKRKIWIDGFAVAQGGGILITQMGSSVLLTDNFELMQYTGLKDKHGKEIYEGYILMSQVVQGLRWGKGTNNPDVEFGDYPPQKITVDWMGSGFGLDPMQAYGFEIIGNIYENPELLE